MVDKTNDSKDPPEIKNEEFLTVIECWVNGKKVSLEVEPRTTLAEVLRNDLGLTGTKIACNHGACSSCTIWLDGKVVASCSILAIEADGKHITTIEGIETKDGALHPVQAAFIEHDAVQCGFCTPGLIMSCIALLNKNPSPSSEQIQEAISGHLCRCGTYPHVVQAILSLSKGNP